MGFKKFIKAFCYILLLLLIIFRFAELYSANHKKFTYKTYIVSHGETLWSIAKETCSGMDPRKVVAIIKDKNRITPVIYPGQELQVPVVEEQGD